MHAKHPLFLLLVAFVTLAVPGRAGAATKLASVDDRDRASARLGLRMVSGMTMHGPQGFEPVTRISYAAGGVVGPRFVLGADLGVTALWENGKASFHGDTVGHVFVMGGWFLRASAGVASHTYVSGERRPALGGSLGTGWEFPLGKYGFVALSGDYDARVRSDRFVVRTLLLGISIGGYKKRKR